MKRDEVTTVTFRYIFGYYNTQRVNSFNPEGFSPVAMRLALDFTSFAARNRISQKKCYLLNCIKEERHAKCDLIGEFILEFSKCKELLTEFDEQL